MISILAPSRGRVLKSYDTIKKWCTGKNSDNVEVILSLDNNDPQVFNYITHYGHHLHNDTGISPSVICSDNRSAVDAINKAAKAATGDILIVVSDDTEPCNAWPEYIYHEANGKTDWIMKTKDGIQDWIITFPILDRAYYNRTGNIYDPDFEHQFCDTWLTVQADISGRKITSNLLFPHLNDSIKDEVRAKSDATWQQGEKTFIQKVKNTPIEDLRKITDVSMKNWIRNKTGIRL